MAKNKKKKNRGKGKHKGRRSNQGPDESQEDDSQLPFGVDLMLQLSTGMADKQILRSERCKEEGWGQQSPIMEDTPKAENFEKTSSMEAQAAGGEVQLAAEKLLHVAQEAQWLYYENSQLAISISRVHHTLEESNAQLKSLKDQMIAKRWNDALNSEELLSLKKSIPQVENEKEKFSRWLELLEEQLRQEQQERICMQEEISDIRREVERKLAYMSVLCQDFETLESTASKNMEHIDYLIRLNLELIDMEAGDSERREDRRLKSLLEELMKIHRQIGAMLQIEWFLESKEIGGERQEKKDSFGDSLRKLQSKFGKDCAHIKMQLSGYTEVKKDKAVVETFSQEKQELISGIDELMMEFLYMDVAIFILQNVLCRLGHNVDGNVEGVENHGFGD